MFTHELASAGLRNSEMTAAYAACGRYLARRNCAAFPVARFLLPPGKRPYYDAMLAFCGYADDLLDTTDGTASERGDRFDAFQAEFFRRLTDPPDAPPPADRAALICRALAHTVRTWDMDVNRIRRFLTTLRTDLDTTTYRTFEDLERYMSSVSGDMSIWVNTLLEPRDDEAAEKAVALGYGVYMLDFLQDVSEDIALGRVYLPLADLERHGVSHDDLATAAAHRRMTAPLREAVRFQTDRIQGFFRQADGWHHHVHPSGRELPRQYLTLGRNALNGLLRDNYDIFRRRPTTRLTTTTRALTTTTLSYLRATTSRRT
ncbi:phytoene/squalene synthase family protein, partial [Streptomyces sp. URMC 129]|uniref:phytoene/squalene synthase family protein n=1 Tax=Streptomyces sp. URMC 129 TaxID=3423407 RepID=UPI003F1AD53A